MSKHNPESILRRLEWTVIRRLDGLLQGDYRTLFRGFGFELADLREYQLGDDIRYIDWNVTARMQAPFVRQYREDREINASFVLDLSPSTEFGTSRASKRDLLIDFVTVLARLLTRQGNRVGAILYTDKVSKIIPPRSGQRQVLLLTHAVLDAPHVKNVSLTDLGAVLQSALRTSPRRSLVFVVSDFISLPGWEQPLGMLAQRHEVLAIRLCDQLERELPDVGWLTLEDSETGEQLIVDTNDRAFRRRFNESAMRRDAELRLTFARAGVDLLELSTDDDLTRAIVQFALLRRQRKQAERIVKRKRRVS